MTDTFSFSLPFTDAERRDLDDATQTVARAAIFQRQLDETADPSFHKAADDLFAEALAHLNGLYSRTVKARSTRVIALYQREADQRRSQIDPTDGAA